MGVVWLVGVKTLVGVKSLVGVNTLVGVKTLVCVQMKIHEDAWFKKGYPMESRSALSLIHISEPTRPY